MKKIKQSKTDCFIFIYDDYDIINKKGRSIMNGFAILMLIFGISVLLVGLYMYTGHKIELLTNRPAYKNLSIEEWKNIGKWTMITSIVIFLVAAIAYIFNIQ